MMDIDIDDIRRNLCCRRFGRLLIRWYKGSNSDFINWGVLRDRDFTLICMGRLELEWV
jgi:hypothetical protein